MKSSSSRSSNRAATITEAVLVREARDRGPVRLPANRADEFIALFNRLYEGVGLELQEPEPTEPEPTEPEPIEPEQKKIPGSPGTTGDRMDDSSASVTDHVT